MPATIANTAHPSVDWQVLQYRKGTWCVQVTCPVCHQARFEPARTVRHRLRKERFTGLCRADWRRRRGQLAEEKRPGPTPPHPAVDWTRVRHEPGGMVVQVTCPVCQEPRFEPAKSVRYRISHETFTGRCRSHAHTAVQARAAGEQSIIPHPAVDWSAQQRRDGELWVTVTCPRCGRERLDLAKSVRFRLRKGTFTGLCRLDAQRGAPEGQEPGVVLPASTGLVRVVCPICKEERLVSGASVRRQMRMGTFTGRCSRDRLIGMARSSARPKPDNPWIDWNDREIVKEGPNRRRTMIRVHCPQCSAVRLSHPAGLERALLNGTFRPECALHRRNPLPAPSDEGRPGGRFPLAG